MKKQLAIIIFLALVISLSSCDLFKCKHKEYSEKVVEPNCFAEGYTEHTCTKCEESYKDNYTPKTHHYFVGAPCPNCGMEEITDNITPDTEWYSEEIVVFDLATKEQLAGLASLVNSGTDFSGVKIYLDADIDLGYYEWIPIGNADHAFNGTFDGDGHTISGLKINAGVDYIGLFGNVSGKISNFSIVDANIYVKRDHNYVSIACGYSTGDLKDISTDGFIEAPKANYVGAVAGAVAPASIEYTNLTSNASINAQTYVGGIIGQINASGNLQTNYISNTGSVKGVSQVGGIFGHVNGASGSLVSGASVSADIAGDYYVGGIVGKADNVAISTCTNDGSTITSSSYYTEGSNYYVWLGGIVGYGYSVINCTNNVDITYNAKGSYVGGIAGYMTGDINDCTNNGDITTNTNCVGGLVGELNSSEERNITNLTNNGVVYGSSKVGGIAGSYKINLNKNATEWYQDVKKGTCSIITCAKTQYYHKYCLNITISSLSNFGKITADMDVAGGIIGDFYINNSYTSNQKCHEKIAHSNYCQIVADVKLVAEGFVNKGEISSYSNGGEIFGQFSSDAPSTITNYTVMGKITVNGEVKEGTYDIGSNSNLTLSGREIYTEATEENTETVE